MARAATPTAAVEEHKPSYSECMGKSARSSVLQAGRNSSRPPSSVPTLLAKSPTPTKERPNGNQIPLSDHPDDGTGRIRVLGSRLLLGACCTHRRLSGVSCGSPTYSCQTEEGRPAGVVKDGKSDCVSGSVGVSLRVQKEVRGNKIGKFFELLSILFPRGEQLAKSDDEAKISYSDLSLCSFIFRK